MFSEILDFQLFVLSGTAVTVGTAVTALFIVLASFIISRILQRTIDRTLRPHVIREGSVQALQRLVHYTAMIIGLAVAFDTVGISLSALFAAGAIFAIGLGFAMQNIAQNFVSGVILLLERSIKPGDIIEVNNTVVRVDEMGIRAAIVRTLDDEELIVPNSLLVQATVKNFTLGDSQYRIRVPVGVTYGSDLTVVRDTLEQVARDADWRLSTRDPVILLTSFGSSSVDFEVSVWITSPWDARRVRSQLHYDIWWALKEAGVTIAFPQLDVHFDPPIMDSVRALTTRTVAA